MKTVDKALRVLDQFSTTKQEIGLSEIARMADVDKAATRRLLVALIKHDFIEQSPETKRYRLGHGFLRLARIREATVPVSHIARDVVRWLVAQTNETVHASLPGPQGMTSIAYEMPNRARVVNINAAELLAYHATASGLVFLAFATAPTAARILALDREKLAAQTATSRADLKRMTAEFRAQGYALTRSTFEDDVASIAMPFFSEPGDPTGTIAIAVPEDEMTADRRADLAAQLREAVRRIELGLTGL